MQGDIKASISDTLSNVVENAACRIAERGNGRVAPVQLLPYLPMSLEVIDACLDSMVDGSSVLRDDEAELVQYVFTAYSGEGAAPARPSTDECLSCGREMNEEEVGVLCDQCGEQIRAELSALAGKIGWPAQAVYEHEIAYLAARQKGAVHAEDLAARSRYTLRRMRRKLDRMSVGRFIGQELDARSGLISYHLPQIEYPAEQFRSHMGVIRSHPASYQEDLEIKVVRVLVTLGLLMLCMLALAFMHVPFPLLILGFLVVAPIVSISILKRRSNVVED